MVLIKRCPRLEFVWYSILIPITQGVLPQLAIPSIISSDQVLLGSRIVSIVTRVMTSLTIDISILMLIILDVPQRILKLFGEIIKKIIEMKCVKIFQL